jgi:hypothetical protein
MQSMANSAEARGTERRRIPRQKSFLRGMIYFNNRRSVADCLIRDISPYGARLIFSDTVTTPDLLDLYIPQKEQTLRSQVIWRVGHEVGVAFPQAIHPQQSATAASGPGDLADRVAKLEAEVAALKRALKKLTAGSESDIG